MGKSAWKVDPPWSDLPKQQWELLWQGEAMWKKHDTRIWDTGHKTVTLFRGTSRTPLHTILWMTEDGVQTHHDLVPSVKRVPVSVRNTIQAYLNLVDWRHIQEGGPLGDVKDWATSLEFTQ